MTFGSLFSGIGGFDLGFERAGMECKFVCEINKEANDLLREKFPNAKVYDDVRTITGTESVDVLCGGFPCQDLSVAGKREGLAGERSGLWHEFRRIIAESRPRYVVIENVPGLLSSNGGRDFAIVIRGLAQLGYGVCWRVLDSQYFGVPQRRRRVFIVGSLGNGRAAEILFEREGVFGNPPTRKGERERTAQVSGTLSANGGGTSRPAGNCNELDFCIPVASALVSKFRSDAETETLLPIAFNPHAGKGFALCDGTESPTLRTSKVPAIAFNWQAGAGQGISVQDDQSRTLIVNQTPAVCIKGAAIGRKPENGPQFGETLSDASYTLNCTEVHAVTQGFAVRRFTPKETERLQGFPDDWTAKYSDTARYRMTGNAVTVNVAEWLGKRIMEAA